MMRNIQIPIIDRPHGDPQREDSLEGRLLAEIDRSSDALRDLDEARKSLEAMTQREQDKLAMLKRILGNTDQPSD